MILVEILSQKEIYGSKKESKILKLTASNKIFKFKRENISH